jgi:hypothetical protein
MRKKSINHGPNNFETFEELQAFLEQGKAYQVPLPYLRKEATLQTEANTSANISQDSFIATNNFRRVVIQQGVPITDYDLNEIGEIADYTMSNMITDIIGSGPPTASPNGYKCAGTSLNNDFTIAAGRLYVADSPKGGATPLGVCLTCAGFNYTTQPVPSVGGVQTSLPALTTPSGSRADTIWLEVYVQDYGPLDNTALFFMNPRTSSNTDVSHRIKTFANIRVWENSGAYSGLSGTAITSAPFYNSAHAYYPLANLARTAGAAITSGMITDLRPRISHTF